MTDDQTAGDSTTNQPAEPPKPIQPTGATPPADTTLGTTDAKPAPYGESPGGTPMGAPGIRYISVYFAIVFLLIFHGLSILWPPNRDRDEFSKDLERIKKIEAEIRAFRAAGTGSGRTPPAARTAPASDPLTTSLGTDLGADLGTDLVTDFATGFGENLETDLGTDLGTTDFMTSQEPDGKTGGAQGNQAADGKGQNRCPQGQDSARLFGLPLCLSPEERLFLIVMFAGALGGLVHALRSFYWYLGNRTLVTSWAGMYVSLPLTGAAMGTLFYLLVRGGFFSPQSEISDTSPFGFAALAALVGMFTEQAALKLRQIAETIFSPAEKGKDDAAAPKLGTITPAKGKKGGMVKIAGSNFVEKSRVTFGGQAAETVTFKSSTLLEVVLPDHAAGPVPVEVINPDGLKDSKENAFTYE